MTTAVTVSGLSPVGQGVNRPEHVMVTRDGRLFASDKSSAIAEISASGDLRRIGAAGGEPNGFAIASNGDAIVANFGYGVLQRVDLGSGLITILADGEVDGRSIRWINFALVDSTGAIWASVSTQRDDLMDTIVSGAADGFLCRFDPDGSNATVVAENVGFPNCMALDRDEEFLYVVRTVAADIVRFPIHGDQLGAQEIFSPPLGNRRSDEFGPAVLKTLDDPATMRRWGMADGCGFDAEGNLWVTLVFGNRIVVVSPDRQVTTVVEDPDGSVVNAPTSVAWGGEDMRDVYIGSMSASYVVKGRSSVPGMPMIHQRIA
jgi:sugar lactone lactonase YvrE